MRMWKYARAHVCVCVCVHMLASQYATLQWKAFDMYDPIPPQGCVMCFARTPA